MSASDLPPTVAAMIANSDGHVEVRASSPLALVGTLASWASERGVDLPDLEVTRPTLEDIYLQLTEAEP